MTDNESKDASLGLLLMVLTLNNRVEKLEKEVWKEKPAAVNEKSDAIWNGEEVNLRESVEKFQKEQAGLQKHINKVTPVPVPNFECNYRRRWFNEKK